MSRGGCTKSARSPKKAKVGSEWWREVDLRKCGEECEQCAGTIFYKRDRGVCVRCNVFCSVCNDYVCVSGLIWGGEQWTIANCGVCGMILDSDKSGVSTTGGLEKALTSLGYDCEDGVVNPHFRGRDDMFDAGTTISGGERAPWALSSLSFQHGVPSLGQYVSRLVSALYDDAYILGREVVIENARRFCDLDFKCLGGWKGKSESVGDRSIAVGCCSAAVYLQKGVEYGILKKVTMTFCELFGGAIPNRAESVFSAILTNRGEGWGLSVQERQYVDMRLALRLVDLACYQQYEANVRLPPDLLRVFRKETECCVPAVRCSALELGREPSEQNFRDFSAAVCKHGAGVLTSSCREYIRRADVSIDRYCSMEWCSSNMYTRGNVYCEMRLVLNRTHATMQERLTGKGKWQVMVSWVIVCLRMIGREDDVSFEHLQSAIRRLDPADRTTPTWRKVSEHISKLEAGICAI